MDAWTNGVVTKITLVDGELVEPRCCEKSTYNDGDCR